MSITVTLQNLGPPSNTPTPTFSALVSDPSLQVKARFTVYQQDGTTKIGTVDSNYITGSGIVQAQFSTSLPIGTYKVAAKAINTNNEESAESQQVTFIVAYAVPKEYRFVWDVSSFFTVVQDDIGLQWDVSEDDAKSLVLKWHSDENILKTIGLRWNVNPTWREVEDAEPLWAKVAE